VLTCFRMFRSEPWTNLKPAAILLRLRSARCLTGWTHGKKIAVDLKRDVTTVQRWERREGMPVHRHLHDKQGSVSRIAPSSTTGRRAVGCNSLDGLPLRFQLARTIHL